MIKLFFTYMVLCSDDSFYVGFTNDVIRRILEHNSDDFPKSHCHKRRPVQLVHVRTFFSPEEAISYEKQTQKWSRKKKWALAMGDLDLVHKLAECRNETHFKNISKRVKLRKDQSHPFKSTPIVSTKSQMKRNQVKRNDSKSQGQTSDDEH